MAVFAPFCLRLAYVFDSLLAGAIFLEFGPHTMAVAAAVAVAVTRWLRQWQWPWPVAVAVAVAGWLNTMKT